MSDCNSVPCPNLTQRHSDPEQRAGSESRYFASAATTGGTNTEILDCKQSRMTTVGAGAGEDNGRSFDCGRDATFAQDDSSVEVEEQDVTPFDKLHEECGVMAIYGHPDAARLTYWGLYALQHRGQESAGIAAADGHDVTDIKGMGLVSEIFTDEIGRAHV